MINNYYTIAAVARSCGAQCPGWVAGRAFTQRRNELTLPLAPPGAASELSLIASCEPSSNFLVTRDSISRASRNSADIFPELEGQIVRAVTIHSSDRIVAVSFTSGAVLLYRFFGSKANVQCIEPPGSPPRQFLTSKDASDEIGFPFPPIDATPIERRLSDLTVNNPEQTIAQALRSSVPTLGPVLAREVLFRCAVDPSTTNAGCTNSMMRGIGRTLHHLLEELLERPSPRIITRKGEPVHFSLVPLHHLGECEEDPQPSVSRGVLRYLSLQKHRNSFLAKKKALLATLSHDIEKTRASQHALLKALPSNEEIALLERFGTLLHTHLPDIEKGMDSFTVRDTYEQNEVVRTIPLETAISPARNAERYFERAKNARSRTRESSARLRALGERLTRLRAIEAEAEATSGPDDMETFIRNYGDEITLPREATTGGKRASPAPPFRVYTVRGGFQVWVGKNSSNNDLLTTRHTAKNDRWFHARGVGGSHVVLKAGTGKGEISKQAILEAAAIAAFYSKMKKARHVAVSMCEGKFVRKPRKAPIGTVTIEREEVLFVDPQLPDKTP